MSSKYRVEMRKLPLGYKICIVTAKGNVIAEGGYTNNVTNCRKKGMRMAEDAGWDFRVVGL